MMAKERFNPFFSEVVERFGKVATTQEEKGLQKYRQSLDPLDIRHDWLLMAEEELVDGYKYLNAERVRRAWVSREIQEHLQRVFVMLNEVENDMMESAAEWDDTELNSFHRQFDKIKEPLYSIGKLCEQMR